MKKFKSFKDFTNLYEVQKTLRFELKPVGRTADLLKEKKVFEKDQTINDSYNQAKFYFDTLHQKFINSALAIGKVESLPFGEFADRLSEQNSIINKNRLEITELRKEKDKATEIDKLQKNIYDAEDKIDQYRKELYVAIKKSLDDEADFWKKDYQEKEYNDKKIKFSKADIKQKGTDFLTSAGVLNILKYEFPENKEQEFRLLKWPSLYVEEQESEESPKAKRYIFDSFDKFSGYLSKFQQTRKNLYADDGIAMAVATRIVDNLVLFLQNKKVFTEKYSKIYSEIGVDETSIFNIENYEQYLLQNCIESLTNNDEENNKSYNQIIGSMNQKIKEYRDKKEKEAKAQKDKNFQKSQYPLFKKLDKQILGKVEKEKQLIEKTEEKSEERILVERFQEFININQNKFNIAKKLMVAFFADEFLENYADIYFKNTAVNTIARKWFADARNFESKLPQKKSKKKDDEPNIKKFISLFDIKNATESIEGDIFKEFYYEKKIIQRGNNNQWQQFLDIWRYEFDALFAGREKENGKMQEGGYNVFLIKASGVRFFSREKTEIIAAVKNYADASLAIFQMMKYFALDDKDRVNALSQLSTEFYAQYDEYYKDFEFIKYYNAFRNFITKKPFDANKIKLNFEKGNLLGGWAESPKGNAQFCAYILRKQNLYYLAISQYPHFLDIEKYKLETDASDDYFKKLEYRSLDWGKNIAGGQVYPSFAHSRLGERMSYQEHKKKLINKKGEHVAFIRELIRAKYLQKFPELQNFLDQDYSDAKNMQKEFSKLKFGGMKFVKIKTNLVDTQEIKEKNKSHKLFVFEILNRDFRNLNKKSSKNIHTVYWENLFSDDNFKRGIFDICGGAEIFYRKATNNLPVRKNKNGIEMVNQHGKKIVEHRRYGRDIIIFHIPIAINAGKGNAKKFNLGINKKVLFKNEKINIIGIDRGEKNLIYYSVINQKGDIYEQGSLNKIEIGGKEVNFYDKLVEKEKERLVNRQSWEPVAKIKDLKDGYISHVIHKICQLVEKYNAIVVLEDLNMRFKQIRGGIERSVYSQLEKKLINKFGYLVFKDDRGLFLPGGVLNGYQLSAPFVSFEKMGKQTGIIFYTQADYTSITDPLTGFRKNLYISNSAPQKKIRETIEKFNAIGWDEKEQSYFFKYDPVNFASEKDKNGVYAPEGGWTIYAKAPRIRREKDANGYWEYKKIYLNEKFAELFKIWNFNGKDGIKQQILEKDKAEELKGEKIFDGKLRSFYHSFIYLFNLVLQLRNSFSLQIKMKDGKVCETELPIDFIASPVKPFFTTEAIGRNSKILSSANFSKFENKFIGLAGDKQKFIVEFNGDANGAYNIARKGIMILKRISENPEKPDLFISKNQWDEATAQWAKENGV